MLDGLRREFPEVVTAGRRVPSPRVARAPLLWSVMAAFGAQLLVSAIVTIAFSILLRSTTREAPLPAPFELARLAATAAALAVAWTAGGRGAVAGFVGVVLLESLINLPGRLRFCGSGGQDPVILAASCSLDRYAIGLWPQLFGVALAFLLARWLRSGVGDRNPTLEAAGVFAFAQGLGGALLNAALGPAAVGQPGSPLTILFVAIGAGIAMAFTILRRTTRAWRTLGVVALIVGGEFFLLSLPLFVSQVLQARGTNLFGPFDLIAYFSLVFAFGAAALVLYIAAARTVTATESA